MLFFIGSYLWNYSQVLPQGIGAQLRTEEVHFVVIAFMYDISEIITSAHFNIFVFSKVGVGEWYKIPLLICATTVDYFSILHFGIVTDFP